MSAYVILVAGIVLNVAGQFLFRAWNDGGPYARWLFAAGMLCFNLDHLDIFWAYSLKKGISFVETGLWWDTGAMFLLLVGNWYFFGWKPTLVAFVWILVAAGSILMAKQFEH